MNWFLIAAVCLNFSLNSEVVDHKFYVSNTIIEFNRATGNFEVTCKLFTDDLEVALTNSAGHKISLSDKSQSSQLDMLIDTYIQKNFKITFNDRPVILSYVGHESEVDLTYAYFEIVGANDFSVLTIDNSLLLEIYPEQKNIVDVRNGGWTRTAILTKEKQREVIYR